MFQILLLGLESSSPLFHCIADHSIIPRDKGVQRNKHRRHPSSTLKNNPKVGVSRKMGGSTVSASPTISTETSWGDLNQRKTSLNYVSKLEIIIIFIFISNKNNIIPFNFINKFECTSSSAHIDYKKSNINISTVFLLTSGTLVHA